MAFFTRQRMSRIIRSQDLVGTMIDEGVRYGTKSLTSRFVKKRKVVKAPSDVDENPTAESIQQNVQLQQSNDNSTSGLGFIGTVMRHRKMASKLANDNGGVENFLRPLVADEEIDIEEIASTFKWLDKKLNQNVKELDNRIENLGNSIFREHDILTTNFTALKKRTDIVEKRVAIVEHEVKYLVLKDRMKSNASNDNGFGTSSPFNPNNSKNNGIVGEIISALLKNGAPALSTAAGGLGAWLARNRLAQFGKWALPRAAPLAAGGYLAYQGITAIGEANKKRQEELGIIEGMSQEEISKRLKEANKKRRNKGILEEYEKSNELRKQHGDPVPEKKNEIPNLISSKTDAEEYELSILRMIKLKSKKIEFEADEIVFKADKITGLNPAGTLKGGAGNDTMDEANEKGNPFSINKYRNRPNRFKDGQIGGGSLERGGGGSSSGPSGGESEERSGSSIRGGGGSSSGPSGGESEGSSSAVKTDDEIKSLFKADGKPASADSHPLLAADREKFFKELDADPALKEKVMRMALSENSQDPRGPIERLMNAAAGHIASGKKTTIRKLLHNGFYGPINEGKTLPPVNESARKALDAVKGGSNTIGLRTDQGMIHEHRWADDMNKITPGRGRKKFINGDWYSDHSASMEKWSQNFQKEMDKYDKENAGKLGPLMTSFLESDTGKAYADKYLNGLTPGSPEYKEALGRMRTEGGADLEKAQIEHYRKQKPESIANPSDGNRIIPNGVPSEIIDKTDKAGFGNRFGTFRDGVKGLIVHHTSGRGTSDGVINTFKQRQYPAQFIMERDGTIVRALPEGARGQHMKRGKGVGAGLGNHNTEGIEVIAKNNSDWTPEQKRAMVKFTFDRAAYHGFDPRKMVFGHGEVNPHKQKNEGMTFVDYFRKNYDELKKEYDSAKSIARNQILSPKEQYEKETGRQASLQSDDYTQRAAKQGMAVIDPIPVPPVDPERLEPKPPKEEPTPEPRQAESNEPIPTSAPGRPDKNPTSTKLSISHNPEEEAPKPSSSGYGTNNIGLQV